MTVHDSPALPEYDVEIISLCAVICREADIYLQYQYYPVHLRNTQQFSIFQTYLESQW